jgi:rod shape-determining protein MreD
MAQATFLLLLVWTLAGLLIRSSAAESIAVFGAAPDFATLLVVYWGLAGGPLTGVLAGFVVGIVVDADLGRDLGLAAGLLAGVGYLTGSVGSSLHRERPPAQFVVLFLATLLVLAVRTLFACDGDLVAWGAGFPLHVLLRAVYTALLGPVVYLLARAVGAPDFLAHGPTTTQP